MKKLLLLLSSSHHQHQKQGYHYIITEYYTCNTISVSSQVENHICFFVPNYILYLVYCLQHIQYLLSNTKVPLIHTITTKKVHTTPAQNKPSPN